MDLKVRPADANICYLPFVRDLSCTKFRPKHWNAMDKDKECSLSLSLSHTHTHTHTRIPTQFRVRDQFLKLVNDKGTVADFKKFLSFKKAREVLGAIIEVDPDTILSDLDNTWGGFEKFVPSEWKEKVAENHKVHVSLS